MMLDIVNNWGVGFGGRVSWGKRVNMLRKGELEEDRKGGLRANRPNRTAPTGGWCRPLSGGLERRDAG